MTNILFILTIYRNACAHDERFFNLKSIKKSGYPNNIMDTAIHSRLHIPKNIANQYAYGKNDLFAIVIIFKLMLTNDSFQHFKGNLSGLMSVLSRLSTISEEDVLHEMGFPPNWADI